MKRLIGIALVLAACGTETGNGLVTAKAGLVSGTNTANGFTGTDQQGTALTINAARAYVRWFEFKGSTGDGEKTTKSEGPFAANLITRTATPSIGELSVPAGTYKRIDVRFTMAKPSDGVIPAGDPLDGESLIANGTINYPAGTETPFDLALHFEADALFENDEGIEINEGTTNDALLDLDVAGWFSTLPITQCLDDGDLAIENGRIAIKDNAGRCNAIENTLVEAIKASSKLRSK